MIKFPVSEKKNQWLKHKMDELGIREDDIEESFIRSSGSGGQKVNKTSTCVYLKHKPTGIKVKYMKERSQALNRFLARRELVIRLEKLRYGTSEVDIERLKVKKQKSKQAKRARIKYKET